MDYWFIHSLTALAIFGVAVALFKIPAAKGHNKFLYSFLSSVVATVLASIFLRKYIHPDHLTMLFGIVWGAGYALVVLFQMEMLKKIDTNALFPITSTSSNVIVLIIGLLFFHDKISPVQFLGMLLGFFVVGFYNHIHKHITLKNGLFAGAAAIVLLSAFNKSTQKLGAVSVEPVNFIFWQLFFTMLASMAILGLTMRNKTGRQFSVNRNVIVWSAVLGTLNFFGTYEITKALAEGPISLIFTLNSFYILITSLVAWRFFGEKLTEQKVIFILLAIASVILIGIK